MFVKLLFKSLDNVEWKLLQNRSAQSVLDGQVNKQKEPSCN
jgi:hypothetical protein